MAKPSDPAASDPVSEVLALAGRRRPTLGSGRLVSIDGRAGAGKTSLAAAVAAAAPDSHVVHMDDLYAGWDGLPDGVAQLDTLLRPLAAGRPGTYRRWDWHRSDWAEVVSVPPVDLLVVEGVGSGIAEYDDLRTVLVWLEAEAALRKDRALQRDGAAFAPYWDRWAEAERRHFAADRTSERADLAVEG